jgi:hypothetical protein
MTEQKWLACTHPQKMLEEFLRGRASERKLRLFAAACCRRVWHHLTEEQSRRAVDVAERFADGGATTGQRAAALREARKYPARDTEAATYAAAAAKYAADRRALSAAWYAAEAAACHGGQRKARPAEEKAQAALLRCIIGNPFRPLTLSPAWQTPQVVALAQAAYEQRDLPAGTLDLTRLAVLADALEEAGCTGQTILGHLRRPGPHVRGCWVVDLLLGKS